MTRASTDEKENSKKLAPKYVGAVLVTQYSNRNKPTYVAVQKTKKTTYIDILYLPVFFPHNGHRWPLNERYVRLVLFFINLCRMRQMRVRPIEWSIRIFASCVILRPRVFTASFMRTQIPRTRAIGVSHTACKDEFRRDPQSRSRIVFFHQ